MILFTIIFTLLLAALCGISSFKKRSALCTAFVIMEAAVAILVIYAAFFTNEAEAYGSGLFAISFSIDYVGKIVSLLIAIGWLLAAIFSSAYMKHETGEKSFYVFMLLTEAFCLGTTFASNLMTLYIMFEATTLCSMPLVLHSRKKEAVGAAKTYLFYSLGGAFTALLGIALIYIQTSSFTFTTGGAIAEELSAYSLAGAFLCIVGFGAKAGLFPLHAWLPAAHPVAPAPASALLSGLITKSGVIAIIRIIYFVIGPDKLTGTWVQETLLILALATVLIGSVLALRENELKKRLAFSSVSQISYVLTGLFIMNETAYNGAILQIVFHAIVKIGLFLAAGALIYLKGKKNVSDYVGIGKSYPVTMWCFTLLSLSLIGIPPFGGFFSKWNISVGALQGIDGWLSYAVPAVLLVSALYTAGYLLPVAAKAFFPGKDAEIKQAKNQTEPIAFTLPLVVLSAAALLGGIFFGNI